VGSKYQLTHTKSIRQIHDTQGSRLNRLIQCVKSITHKDQERPIQLQNQTMSLSYCWCGILVFTDKLTYSANILLYIFIYRYIYYMHNTYYYG
jgi:hypothetical protein